LGLDLGGTKIEIAALGPDGATLIRKRIAAPQGDYAATIRGVRDLVAQTEEALGAKGTVGIGMPGAISPRSGLVKNANSTWLNGKPFESDLSNALARPVRLANDANCFALSEAVDGAGKGKAVVFGAILGTGVGGGIAVNGAVLTGPNAIAGEWGHNPLPWARDNETPGHLCYCGKKGCIETWISGPALVRELNAATIGEPISPQEAAELAHLGDKRVEAILQTYELRLAKSLAALIDILDPDIVVLGGGLSNMERLYANVPPAIERFAFSDAIATPVVKNVWGDSSGVRGAAWLWGGPPA
jgi:fructokinase